MDQVHHARSEKVLLWQISLKYSSFFWAKFWETWGKKQMKKQNKVTGLPLKPNRSTEKSFKLNTVYAVHRQAGWPILSIQPRPVPTSRPEEIREAGRTKKLETQKSATRFSRPEPETARSRARPPRLRRRRRRPRCCPATFPRTRPSTSRTSTRRSRKKVFFGRPLSAPPHPLSKSLS